MSILSRAGDTYLPLAVACAHIGYATDHAGQKNLKRQLRKKGFDVRRVGGAFSVQVSAFQAYIKRCEQDNAAHRAKISALTKARWAAKRGASPEVAPDA